MGQARTNQNAAEALARPDDVTLGHLAAAMKQVLGAIANFHGAECLSSALIGTEVLRRLGYDARATAGSAAWRVGPGGGDVISHAVEMQSQQGKVYAPNLTGSGMRAGMFHAWSVIGDYIVDFTTSTLREKASQLDAQDGGKTQVDWAPEVLWAHKYEGSKFPEVANGYKAGTWVYRKHEEIERQVFTQRSKDFDAQTPATVVLQAFELLKSGGRVQVIGLGDDGPQTLETAIEAGRARGHKDAKPVWPGQDN